MKEKETSIHLKEGRKERKENERYLNVTPSLANEQRRAMKVKTVWFVRPLPPLPHAPDLQTDNLALVQIQPHIFVISGDVHQNLVQSQPSCLHRVQTVKTKMPVVPLCHQELVRRTTCSMEPPQGGASTGWSGTTCG